MRTLNTGYIANGVLLYPLTHSLLDIPS